MLKTSLPARVRRFFLALLLLMTSFGAWAQCSGTVQTIPITLPSSVSVPRDLPAGAMLTDWISSPSNSALWSCTAYGVVAGSVEMIGSLSTPSGTTISWGGKTYTVWNTNLSGVGIAIAFSSYLEFGGCGFGWGGWGSATSSWGFGWGCSNANGVSPIGGRAMVALVKTSNTATLGGTISGATVLKTAPYYNGVKTALADSFVITPVTVVPMSCTTPNVNVPMGTFKTTDFPTVGSLSPGAAAPVNIQLVNCPAGTADPNSQGGQIHSVQYSITPSAGTVATNVAALSGSPSATGVGIQLFDPSGAVLPLSTPQTVSGYDGTVGGNYTIPLTARYYRTGTVTAGPANTTMTVTLSYQ